MFDVICCKEAKSVAHYKHKYVLYDFEPFGMIWKDIFICKSYWAHYDWHICSGPMFGAEPYIYIYICVCVCLCNHTFVCILGWHNQGPARVPRDPARGPRDLRAHGSVANPPEAWTKNAYTLPKNKQVHVVHQTMLPRILAKSFVGQSFANALCPPAFRKRRTWT